MIHGVDISSYQGSPDLSMMASQAAFIICRHSIGALRDTQFERNWAGLEGKTVRGLYYVPHPKTSHDAAKAQLRDAIARNPDLPIALDVEIAGVYVDRVYAQAMYLYQQTGKYPMIYTSPGFWGSLWGKATKTHADFFIHCPLWIAHYTSAARPTIPKPWTEWAIWQYGINSDRAFVEAHGLRYWEAKAIDVNRYNGDLMDLYAWCGLGEVIPPDQPEPDIPTPVMDRYVRVRVEWLRFRRQPSLYAGDTLAVGRGVRLRVTGDRITTDIDYWPVELDGYPGYVSAGNQYTELV